MTSKQMWTKLSTILTEVLNEHFDDQDDVDAVMTRWNEHRGEVTKLFAGEHTTTRKKKDPNHPKRPLSSYMFYCQDNREKARASLPDDAKTTDVSKALGKMWKALSEKKQAPYKKKAEKDKARYQKEMETYTPPEDLGEEEVTVSGRRKRDPNAPKRALSAYMFFAKQERLNVKKDHPDMTFVDITRELGTRWKALSDEQKEPFNEMNARDKERYQREKTAYESGEAVETPAPTPVSAKVPPKSSTKAKAPKTKAKAIKKTPGYELFATEQREQLEEEHPEWGNRRMTTEINKAWRELEEEDRENYEEEASNPVEDESEELESEESESELVEEDV